MIPLLRLPKRAVDIVLRNMTKINQFLLSLYDDHLKSQIRSLNVGIDFKFKIIVGQVFYMCIVGPNNEALLDYLFYNKHQSENDPLFIRLIGEKRGWIIKDQKSARQWIFLIMEVFNLKKIDDLEYRTADFCFDSVKKTLKGIHLEILEVTGNDPLRMYEEVLEAVPPSSHLVQRINPGEKFRRVLLRNFESIEVFFPLNFSEVLSINSRFARFSGANLTMKSLNEFLKLWRKGCNPRVKHFSTYAVPVSDGVDYVKNVMKGIPYQNIPDTVERSFLKRSFSLPIIYEKIQGGFDFTRMTDGQRATVKLEYWYSTLMFNLFVWED